jgi:hypothetical protein
MMKRGSQLPIAEATTLETIWANSRAYVSIGLRGAFYFIGLWTSVAYCGVLAVANTSDGTMLGLRQCDSVWVAVVVNLPIVAAAVYEFHPGARNRVRRLVRQEQAVAMPMV